MKIIEREGSNVSRIEVGDLVEYCDSPYLVTLKENIRVKSKSFGEEVVEFPYMLLDMKDGTFDNSFQSIEGLNDDCRLLAKSRDMELYY